MTEAASLNARTGSRLGARASAWVAWSLWLIAVAAGVLGLLYGIKEQATGQSIVIQTGLSYLAGTGVAVAYASVGLLLRVRRPGLVIGWLFLGIGLLGGLANMSWGYVLLSAAARVDPGPLPGPEVAWIANFVQAPAWLALAIALVLLFPDGRVIGPAWRFALNGVWLTAVVLAVCLGLAPGPLQFFPFVANPHPVRGLLDDLVLIATPVLLLIMAIFALAAAWSMVLRYRRGTTVERHQLKWFAWASTLAIAAGLVEIVMAGPWFPSTAGAADISWLVFTGAAVTLPAAALVAILRYRLYDIDRLIGRTFVYGALTAILAGLYAASIRLFTAIFVGVTGESSDIALVLTTLVLATTFTPIKQRLESVASERLHDPVAARTGSTAETSATPDEAGLEQRMEDIARRVSREVLAAELSKPRTDLGVDEEPKI